MPPIYTAGVWQEGYLIVNFNTMSQEYIAAIVLILGSVLKLFHVEIENNIIEAIVAGALALWIAIRRFKKGDINVLGARK